MVLQGLFFFFFFFFLPIFSSFRFVVLDTHTRPSQHEMCFWRHNANKRRTAEGNQKQGHAATNGAEEFTTLTNAQSGFLDIK